MKKFGYILLSAVALILACKKQEEDKPQPVVPKIEIPAESQAVFSQGISLEAGEAAQNQTVKFTATAAWTADVADVKSSTWLSVSPTSGPAGSVTLTVTAKPNNEKLDREASVTIKCGTASQKFTVRQAGIPNVDVTSVTLDKKALELVEGDEATLTATVKPDDATDKTVTWSSDQAEVASVDETGKVSAIKEGQASIIAKAGECSDTCVVTVAKKFIPVDSVALSKKTLELVEGDEAQLTATVLPEDATDPTVTWTTDKADIASVDEAGKVVAIKEGQASIIAKAGEKADTCLVTVAKKIIPVTSVTLDKPSLDLIKGEEITLTATVKPDDATEKTVSWTTSDAAVATVTDGKVKAVASGTATITARAGDQSATCEVKVTVPVSSVTLSKATLSMVEGDEVTLSATVAPEDATDKTVTWSTSNEAVTTVQEGKVVAVKEGTATITAKAGDKSATCTVTVAKKVIPVTSITLDKVTLALTKGAEATLTPTVKPDDATDNTVAWSTSDAKVVTVENGKLKAVGGGEATVTAKAGDQSATCAVTVKVPVSGISLDNTSVALKEGQEIQLSAIVAPNDATDKTVTWSTDKADIAIVDNTGKVKAVKEGTATITAKAGDKTATCTVAVSKNVIDVTSVSLDKSTLNLTKGQEATLAATVKPDNATNKTVTWSTSNAEVATVVDGKVKAVGGGEATITAKAGDQSATCVVKVTVPVSSITLDKTTLDLVEGDDATLSATVKPDDATNPTVTWSSDKPEFATVDNAGKVTAVAPGVAVITAKSGDMSATCTVTVAKRIIPATGITMSPTHLQMFETERKFLAAIVTPSGTTDVTEWSSNNPAAATVNHYGMVTGVASGSAIITAKAGEVSATCEVTVLPVVPVESISLNETELALEKGGASFTLVASLLPEEASFKTVTWTSSNPSVAAVSGSGEVTARGGGEATITATTSNGKTADCHVVVTVPVTQVTISPTGDLELNVGASANLTAKVDPSDATYEALTWESGDKAIATVVNGVVTGVAKGKTTITASAGGKSASINVNVVVPASGVTLNQTHLDLTKGQETTLEATVIPENANNRGVTWSSSNEDVATVSTSGKVKAVGGGNATITATTHNGFTANCTVTVTVPLNSIALNKTTHTLAVDGTFVLTVSFDPTDATDRTVSWEIVGSGNFVAITPNGASCTVTGLAVGEATVTAKVGNASASCAFTVVETPLDNTEGYGEGNGQWDD